MCGVSAIVRRQRLAHNKWTETQREASREENGEKRQRHPQRVSYIGTARPSSPCEYTRNWTCVCAVSLSCVSLCFCAFSAFSFSSVSFPSFSFLAALCEVWMRMRLCVCVCRRQGSVRERECVCTCTTLAESIKSKTFLLESNWLSRVLKYKNKQQAEVWFFGVFFRFFFHLTILNCFWLDFRCSFACFLMWSWHLNLIVLRILSM